MAIPAPMGPGQSFTLRLWGPRPLSGSREPSVGCRPGDQGLRPCQESGMDRHLSQGSTCSPSSTQFW